MQSVDSGRLLKLAAVGVLILAVMAVGLMGNRANRAFAQDSEPQTYMVFAGEQGAGNIEILAFGPSELKVHQGDTVMWHITGAHNINFEEEMANLIIVPENGGPQINPAIVLPTIENGGSYTGGPANSGLEFRVNLALTFSLVMDAPPGRYTYFCDVHPGMVGVIEIVADDEEIPPPAEAHVTGIEELGNTFNNAVPVGVQMSTMGAMTSEDGVANIALGSAGTGRATVNLFAPSTVIIQAGEKVTWTNPADSVDIHFVDSLPYDPEQTPDVIPDMSDPSGPPIFNIGPGFSGTVPDGSTINDGDAYNSGFLVPGQSYTLTFADAGMYSFYCHIHPGMNGVVIVE